MSASLGIVIIGRNEGERLVRCLSSVSGEADRIIYVDSGSTDDSLAHARAAGAEVVELDTGIPFTAARARNAGLAALRDAGVAPDLVQFIDGDCELQRGWLDQARGFLETHDEVAAVSGRLREQFPDKSLYNRLIDHEWDTPIGETRACGGIAMMRHIALDAVGGFDSALIAGEEPELCVRLRGLGWKIWRLDAEMALHDADMHRFSQWWKRAKRAGHAYAEGVAMHGAAPERHNVVQMRRALIWGTGPLVLLVLGVLISPWIWLGLMAWPLQFLRLARRYGDRTRAGFMLLGKLPEALGILGYHWTQLTGRQRRLIEYK